MQNYNLTILINNKVDEKGRTAVIDGVKKDFGNLVKEDLWGVRTLAYEIKHMDKAFYVNFEFESEPQAIITLDKNIRLNEDIIRYLLIKNKVTKQIKAKKSFIKDEAKKEEKVEDKDKEKGVEALEAKADVKDSEEKPVTKKRIVKIVKKA